MNPSSWIRPRLGRRAAAFSLVALIVGVPALALRLLCVGGSCDTSAEASPYAPFCSLPPGVRASVTESTRDGRSGELLMVARQAGLSGGSAFRNGSSLEPRWPSLEGRSDQVPIVIAGPGIARGASLPADAGLDDVAATISELVGFDRPHPEVRSGQPLTDVGEPPPESPKVVIVMAWKGVGSSTLSRSRTALPNLDKLLARGSGTLRGTNNSYSSDPAAPLTTLGTGGLPSQHGITGSLLRNEQADLVRAWSEASPINVIATLAEDLDEALDQEPVVALVGTQEIDKGLIGGDWYVSRDRDLIRMLPERSPVKALTNEAQQLLRVTPLGQDSTPDILGIAQQGPLGQLDRELGRLWRSARKAVGEDFVLVLAGTGSANDAPASDVGTATQLISRLEQAVPGRQKVIEGAGPGEVFIDQEVLEERKISDEVILDVLLDMKDPSGEPVFADVFPSVTVTFGRFC